ncbi:MAG: hypothetical protein WAU11_04915 [Ignavibacteriaceae bacterium]
MENTQKIVEPKFSDYIYILYKWKKFILINVFIVVLIFTVISFLIPIQYKATATIMVPPDNQSGFGGLSSLLGGKSSLASLGSKAFGLSNTSEDVLLGILNSRTAITNVINKFNLMGYYNIEDKNWDKVIKAFRGDIATDPNEYGMIDFSITNKDPKVSAEIANYLVILVDSLNIEFNIQRAKNNRLFIEQRYIQNVSDLKKAEDSLFKFQRKYGIVAVPEQLEVTIKAAAEIESQLMRKEMESFFIKQGYGETSPQYVAVQKEIELLNNKVSELKNSSNLGNTSNVLFSFKDMPNIAIQYLRTYREVEIQQSILEIVMPMYEQAKVEEQKSVPTIMIIDPAVPPQLKDSPKKAVIIIAAFFISMFIVIPFVFWMEKSVIRKDFRNPLQLKEQAFFSRIAKIYRIKF